MFYGRNIFEKGAGQGLILWILDTHTISHVINKRLPTEKCFEYTSSMVKALPYLNWKPSTRRIHSSEIGIVMPVVDTTGSVQTSE